jgi:WD40 repeat protein
VDVATGDRITELDAPGGGPAWVVAWGPDGARLAAGHDDGRIRLWEPDSGREVLELRGHDEAVDSLAFSPDGSRLVSSDDAGQVRVWALGIDELLAIARDELVPEPSGQ